MTGRFIRVPLAEAVTMETEGVRVETWCETEATLGGGTVFGCVDRTTDVMMDGARFRLGAGMWFVAPTGAVVSGGQGLAIVLPGYRGLRQFGGPIEERGRLRYIDGCTDTLLVAPPKLGDPCLNHLHIPPHTRQTAHTHPSIRVGIIRRGTGRCITDTEATPLTAGLGWVIPTGTRHCFHTDDQPLDVIAWHPDSDTGPTDENHPMLNRTIVSRAPRGD